MKVIKYKFPRYKNDTGFLVVLEALKDIPFEIKRVYYIYGLENNSRRGFHAHKTLQQVLVCLHGSCKIMLDDGKERIDVTLDDPTDALLIDKMLWRETYDFSDDVVLLVFASEYFDEDDYIRDYDEFLRYAGSLEETKKQK